MASRYKNVARYKYCPASKDRREAPVTRGPNVDRISFIGQVDEPYAIFEDPSPFSYSPRPHPPAPSP